LQLEDPTPGSLKDLTGGELVLRDFCVSLENRVEPALLVSVVNQNDRRQSHRLLAISANSTLAFDVLNEAVGEVVGRARPPGSLRTVRPAMRASEFNLILQWVAIQCRPSRIAHPNCF